MTEVTTAAPPPHARTARRAWLLPASVLAAGLVVFAAFAIACRVFYDQTESRLLKERVDEVSAVLSVAVGQIQTPLNAAATLAQVTDGDPAAFQQAMASYVGEDGSFTSAALYSIDSTTPIVTIGSVSLGERGVVGLDQVLATAREEPFVIVDLLDRGRRLGYGVTDSTATPRFLVYGERTLSADPNVRQRNDEPFANLDYAIYLGDQEDDSRLVTASVRDLPLDGRRAKSTTPFGDNELLIVMSPSDGHLSSALFASLWWIVAVIGGLASLVVAALSRRLIARHDEAIELASDNERLYDEQRLIAETLQLSLLPQVLEPPPGAEVAARYWPAGTASLIGGDFYDVFRVDEQRWAVTIGDVCGKGIEAAAVTGLARHTLRAAARHFDSAADVLLALHRAMSDHRPATFCTVCFVYVDTDAEGGQRMTMALGGHPQALMRRADGSVEEVGELGTLLGIVEPQLFDVVVDVAPGDTMVLYTDGLTDAPGDQAVPIGEVVSLLQTDGAQPVEQLADSIRVLKRRRRPHGSSDDTVVLVLRFGDPRPV
jgi:serine phosphatase RsbU (regulator of sigma subunit)